MTFSDSAHKLEEKISAPKVVSTKKIFHVNSILWTITALLVLITLFLIVRLYNNFSSQETQIVAVQTVKADSLIHVEVMNGCGVTGLGDKLTDYLRNQNFDVIQTGNYYSFDIEKTLVIDRTGNIKNAELVASALGLTDEYVIQQVNKNYFLDVSVIIGKNFNQLKPYY